MRRFTSALLCALVVATLAPDPALAGVPGERAFQIASPALTWPCSPQAVYLDLQDAPSAWHAQVVRDAVAVFARATGREWPLTDDPEAPVRIRWHDPTDHRGALAVLGADHDHYRGADIQLSPRINRAWFHATVLHELGHLGGLEHVTDRTQVMGLDPLAPRDRYQVGDLVGLLIANRSCTIAAARAKAMAAGRAEVAATGEHS